MKFKDIELTPEQLNDLKEYSPISPEKEFDYIPVIFRKLPEDIKPVFHLKKLDGVTLSKLSDVMRGEIKADENFSTTQKFHMGAYYVEAVKKGLKGWSNWYDYKSEKEII